MGKYRKGRDGHSDREPRHVRLYHWIMDSTAWQSLSATDRAIYIEMARRYAGVGSNNGRIRYSVRDATKALRIGKSTVARSLVRLQERGFVVAMQKGHFDWKVGHATEWRLTEFPCDLTGDLASKDFARWKTEDQNAVPVAGPDGTCSGTVRYLWRDRGALKARQ